MTQAQDGDTVRIHYEGRTEQDGVFDTSEGRDPLEFTLGDQEVIPGFEAAVLGMEPGESKTVTIPPAEAYGERRDDLSLELTRDQFPDGFAPEEGQLLELTARSGQTQMVTVTDVKDDVVTVDQNHPLAGKALTFELELVEIVE